MDPAPGLAHNSGMSFVLALSLVSNAPIGPWAPPGPGPGGASTPAAGTPGSDDMSSDPAGTGAAGTGATIRTGATTETGATGTGASTGTGGGSPAAAPSRFVPPKEPARLAEAPLAGDKGRWKPGAGVEVASKDGRFSLGFNALAQLQATALHVPDLPLDPVVPGHTDFTLHFRRARFTFTGNLFSPNIKYRIQLTAAPVELGFKDGVPHRTPILDWFFTFDRFRDFTLVVGQYKVPYNHQRMLRVTGMQFVDRSLANNEFTMDRDIGLDLRSRDLAGLGKLRYYLGVYLGDGIARYGPSNFGLMYLGRFEVLPFGQYDDLEESDHERALRPKMLIGGAYTFIDRDPNANHGFFGAPPLDGGTTSSHNATADLNFKIAGFSLSGAFFWRSGWRQPGTAVDAMGMPIPAVAPRSGVGVFVQAGYLIPRAPLELGARWGMTRGIAGRTGTSLPDQAEIGGVLSYFVARHFVKLQLDYLRLYGTTAGGPGIGADQVRLQLQVMM